MGDAPSAYGSTTERSPVFSRFVMELLIAATTGWMALLMLILAWPDPKTLSANLGTATEAYLAHFALFAMLGALVFCVVFGWKGRRYILVGALAASIIGSCGERLLSGIRSTFPKERRLFSTCCRIWPVPPAELWPPPPYSR